MYLLVLLLSDIIAISAFFFTFYPSLHLMSNRSLDSFSFVTAEALQIGALTCVMSSSPLLRLLLIVINAHNKCITCLGFIHY